MTTIYLRLFDTVTGKLCLPTFKNKTNFCMQHIPEFTLSIALTHISFSFLRIAIYRTSVSIFLLLPFENYIYINGPFKQFFT